MKIHVNSTFEVSDNFDMCEAEDMISEYLNLTADNFNFPDIELLESEVNIPSPYCNSVCILDIKDIDISFLDRFLIEDYFLYIIRVPIEGVEGWFDRILMIENIIEKLGFPDNFEKPNAFFVFDSCLLSKFKGMALDLLLNADDTVKKFAIKNGISFLQWMKKEDMINLRKSFTIKGN
jgi:hypothetical protein